MCQSALSSIAEKGGEASEEMDCDETAAPEGFEPMTIEMIKEGFKKLVHYR